MTNIRYPAVAGMFYPSHPNELIELIEQCYLHKFGPKSMPVRGTYRKPIGLLCPHAGYIYSGPVMAHSYYELSKRVDTIEEITAVILGPNHTGLGSGVSVMDGVWRTPLGDVNSDEKFVEELWKKCDIIDLDETAHLNEHSIEVQLPFLKHLELLNIAKFKIVPICMMFQDYETSIEVGYFIAKIAKELNRRVVIIASSDLSHYEPQEIATKKDAIVIKHILEMNEKDLYEDVINYNISMCGYGPVIAMIRAMKILGATKSELLCYATSGDITGDYSAVVGYASAIVE
ncbi:AmmeMemoRadiSam system protein B [Methanocaldococcus sp.]|uniref:AmmeMemoRadiSam system protein B n=1 Tax=Methanocaldococcus sp. TaxID=2152917 RepID=UPI0026276F8F|nr:AmmeMemoRadiSam system protein B [Methanocaldococcus sp.]MCQ6254801.1 AmmeMemoRadiSam system protein B [Methanocaldococcus sp.]